MKARLVFHEKRLVWSSSKGKAGIAELTDEERLQGRVSPGGAQDFHSRSALRNRATASNRRD
jgi:hypothetical protein